MEEFLNSGTVISIYGIVSILIILLSNQFFKVMIQREGFLKTIYHIEKISIGVLIISYLIKADWMLLSHIIFIVLLLGILGYNIIHKTFEYSKQRTISVDKETDKEKSYTEYIIKKHFSSIPLSFESEYKQELYLLRRNFSIFTFLLILYLLIFLFSLGIPYLVTGIQNNTLNITGFLDTIKGFFDLSDLFG